MGKKRREELRKEIRQIVSRIKIHKRGTPEGDAQREIIRIKYGPEWEQS
jgi:hypothetical protein